MFVIVEEGIMIGIFQEQKDANSALRKYVKSGMIEERK